MSDPWATECTGCGKEYPTTMGAAICASVCMAELDEQEDDCEL